MFASYACISVREIEKRGEGGAGRRGRVRKKEGHLCEKTRQKREGEIKTEE